MASAVYLTVSLLIFGGLMGTVMYGLFRFVKRDSINLDLDMLWEGKFTREQLGFPKD
ncbi:hypothetical protein NV379_07280 [Paenibacillus sp. N1-5-1-14]|uniref:hypothetical protein n=1 Tax=Paenibacillus radicibacter TaxID=2972488 RepID=UPI0021592D7D|nr:hypothetical protein [Paenibacillus radicibacter]MCR8642463.1 hypothetical protein [Paenibacillus radicibacter]